MAQKWGDKTGTSTVLRRIREDGGEAAWEGFVHRYWRVIHGYALACGLTATAAEDVTQTVLAELVQKLPDFEVDKTIGSFRSVLRAMVRWRVADQLRKSTREREAVAGLESLGLNGSGEDAPDARFERAWRDGLLKAATVEVAAVVSPAVFQAFEMTAHRGMPAKEVAKLLGMSVDSVYQAKSQTSKRIQRALNQLCDEAS